MNSSISDPGKRTVKLLRLTLATNFILLVGLVGPGSSHDLDLKLRRLGVENIIVRIVQFWFVGATVVATVLFIRLLRGSISSQRPTKLDLALLLIWWFVATIVCLFAFMVGMGG